MCYDYDPDKVLRYLGELDGYRWNHSEHTSLYPILRKWYRNVDDLDDKVVLTHWLVYIFNRGQRTRKLWSYGVLVWFHIVNDYINNQADPVIDIIGRYYDEKSAKLSLPDYVDLESQQLRLIRLLAGEPNIKRASGIHFSSRFFPEDLFRAIRTLQHLNNYRRSLGVYIIKQSNFADPPSITEALYNLTYYNIVNSCNRITHDALAEALEHNSFVVDGAEKTRMPKAGNKRLLCAVRDFKYSPDIKPSYDASYDAALKNIDPQHSIGIKHLEVPGDTWNNNRVMLYGLFSDKKLNLQKLVRRYRDGVMPELEAEKADVTVLFAPRMCDELNCDICSFGTGAERLCHEMQGRMCPVVLQYIGVRHQCRSQASCCRLVSSDVKGLCRVYRESKAALSLP